MSTANHNPNSRPVGFFDSGVGGLSVYSRFRKVLPAENTLYFGDLANLPYGSKSKNELVGFARNILNFYKTKEVKAVVIACNTSSAQAYDVIKDEYDFKIYPIIQSCAKVIASSYENPVNADSGANTTGVNATGVNATGVNNRIGIFATEATVASGAYTRELKKYNPQLEVREVACPNWVPIVEEGLINSMEAFNDISLRMRDMLSFNPAKIVLGCTHYPYLMSVLKKFAPEEIFVDPAEIFVDYIKKDMPLNHSAEKGAEQIYVSASPERFIKNSKIFYDVKECSLLETTNIA